MKTSLLITIFLCILLIMTGCPGPSSNISGVRTPNAISYEYGDTTVVYQANEGNTRVTYVQWIARQGNKPRNDKGVALYSEPNAGGGGGLCALLERSKYNETILVWGDAQGVKAQKIDAQGRFRWDAVITITANSTYGLQTAEDGAGGVIIAWSDENSQLHLQRIDIDGNTVWKTESPLCNTEYFNMTTDNSGNIFVIWEGKDFHQYVQKLDTAGEPCWTPGGILLSDSHGTGDRMNSIISDGAGGIIVAWIYAIRSEDNTSITGNELYAQRISAEGEILWEPDGVLIRGMSLEPPVSVPIVPQLVSDGAEGAFVIWGSIMSIYAQRINNTGEISWSQGGIEVWHGGNIPRSPEFKAISDEAGGFILAWNYIPEGKPLGDAPEIHAQRFDASGNQMWSQSNTRESPITLRYQGPMVVTADSKGGVIIAYVVVDDRYGTCYSIFKRVDHEGRIVWSGTDFEG